MITDGVITSLKNEFFDKRNEINANYEKTVNEINEEINNLNSKKDKSEISFKMDLFSLKLKIAKEIILRCMLIKPFDTLYNEIKLHAANEKISNYEINHEVFLFMELIKLSLINDSNLSIIFTSDVKLNCFHYKFDRLNRKIVLI